MATVSKQQSVQPSVPEADRDTAVEVLKALWKERSLLSALRVMQRELGNVFGIALGPFRPTMVVGPDANRTVLVRNRDRFLWRTEQDAVTRLLRRGLLVVDGEEHRRLRDAMNPPLMRKHAFAQVHRMNDEIAFVTAHWRDGSEVDMLPEMRKISLLILTRASFHVDFRTDLHRVWEPILAAIRFISPGPWILWPDMPRPWFRRRLRALDDWLFGVVRQKRSQLAASGAEPDPSDLLAALLESPEMSDDLARDQLLTMLIAGHDTSTALLAWAMHLLASHRDALSLARQEVDTVVGGDPVTSDHLPRLDYLDCVIKETLRLYPPIHVGSRRAKEDTEVNGCPVRSGTRLMYSIYLSHRDPDQWPEPDAFRPERFAAGGGDSRTALSYVPFGGGPRNCIGAAFAQVQAKVVLANVLRDFELEHAGKPVTQHMGATLEPRPGVLVRVRRRG